MSFKQSYALSRFCCVCFADLCVTGRTYQMQLTYNQSISMWTHNLLKRDSSPATYGPSYITCRFKKLSNHRSFSAMPDCETPNPYTLLEEDLKNCYIDIKRELRENTRLDELYRIATYYFDGQGKALRPTVVLLMAGAINFHTNNKGLQFSQRRIAAISEMIHSASLIHDDVIDTADIRRGKPSANALWNPRQVTMAGNFILAVTCMMIARLKNNDITLILSKVVTDLIQGELMQLGTRETENERFAHYLNKSYRKTASLLANSSKAVAVLGQADGEISELAFQYGRDLGIAFQLVDDLLDFVSSSDAMGKPTAADLKLGLATAPVLFASEEFPELNAMIVRRFKESGDVDRAFELVHSSRGIQQTRFLAKKHCDEAARLALSIRESPYQRGLVAVTKMVAKRLK